MVHRLSCSAACGIFPNQGLNPVPCFGRWILNHCATRETPMYRFLGSFQIVWVNSQSTVAESYGKSMFSFVRNHQSGCTILHSFSPAMNESSCCSTSLPAFGGVSVPDSGHSSRCVVVSYCFSLHFLDDI